MVYCLNVRTFRRNVRRSFFFFIIKPTRCTKFTNLFWHETLHVSDTSCVHHQEFIHCTLGNGICSCSKAVYKPVWNIPLPSVQWINSWWWTDEVSETCRVSCQNKFVNLVRLFGFIIKKFVTMHGHTNVKYKVPLHTEWLCLGEGESDKEKNFVFWDSSVHLAYGKPEVRVGLSLNNGGYDFRYWPFSGFTSGVCVCVCVWH
jgi:hypothetical protein